MYFLFLLLASSGYISDNNIFINNQNIINNEIIKYSPTQCTVTNYDFTFLYDNKSNLFKIHGLWPEICSECIDCGYPSCCNIESINYTYPYDPTNFILNNWFNTETIEECTGIRNITLFEHEFYKHISCTNLKTTDEFLTLIIFLYNKYYNSMVASNCMGYEQLWLNLNANFEYNRTKCL